MFRYVYETEVLKTEQAIKVSEEKRAKLLADNIARLTKLIDENPHHAPNAENYYKRGRCYKRQGNAQQALSDFTKACELDPQNGRYYLSMGIQLSLLFAQEKNPKQEELALRSFSAAIKNNLHKPTMEERIFAEIAYVRRGKIYARRGDYVKALEDFNAAIDLYPESIEGLQQKGLVLLQQGIFDQAIHIFADALMKIDTANPRHAFFQYDLLVAKGHALQMQGKTDLAIQELTKAVQMFPEKWSAYYHRGKGYLMTQQLKSALADFQITAEINGNQPEYKAWVGYAKLVNSDIDGAKKELDVAINRSCHQATLSIAHLFRAKCHQASGDAAAAKNDLEKVWGLNESDSSEKYYAGVLLLKHDKGNERLKTGLNEILIKHKPSPSYCVIQAMVAAELGYAELAQAKLDSFFSKHLPQSIPHYLKQDFIVLMLQPSTWSKTSPNVYFDLDALKSQLKDMILQIPDVDIKVNALLQSLYSRTRLGGIMSVARNRTTSLTSGRLEMIAKQLEGFLSWDGKYGHDFAGSRFKISEATKQALAEAMKDPNFAKELANYPKLNQCVQESIKPMKKPTLFGSTADYTTATSNEGNVFIKNNHL